MSSALKRLRIMRVVMIVLLFLQYELGMATIMADIPSRAPFGFSIAAFRGALEHAGGIALVHAGFGGIVILVALVNLILALMTKVRSVQILGVLNFLFILVAAGGGLFFVLSGFQNDHASHAMATNFLLAFAFSFVELFYIRSALNSV